MKELITPINMVLRSKSMFFVVISYISKKNAKQITGIDNKNENLAAASRLMPNNRPAVSVTPDLDAPGIKANACAIPIKMIAFSDISYSDIANFFSLSFELANHNRMPNNMVEKQITSIERKLLSESSILTNKPHAPTGIVAITIDQAKRFVFVPKRNK